MPALPTPKLETPWLKGVYEVSPSLRPLGEARAFEFNTLWPRIRANKRLRIPGRVLRSDLDDAIAEAVVESLARRLAEEWPEFFRLRDVLECRLTGEAIPLIAEGLDALAMNLPCDLAIVRQVDGRDWNAYLHVSAPSHWRPEEKIGRSFFATHEPVPHFERVNAAAPKLLQAMIERGPWVRFVWGFETDDDLDHHPDRARSRRFDQKPFLLRIERQVLLPLPEYGASLFLIGVGYVSRDAILAREALWRPLLRALERMSPASREYKGVAEGYEALRAQFPA